MNSYPEKDISFLGLNVLSFTSEDAHPPPHVLLSKIHIAPRAWDTLL
jgi:hypothetical protein